MINHVSNSMLGLWGKCGIAFEYSYLRGIKIPPGVAAHRGGAAHKAFEINHKQKKITMEDLPEADLTDACRDSFVRRCEGGVLIPKEDRGRKDEILNTELNNAIKTVKIYHNVIAPQIIPVIVEKKITVHLGLDLPLIGVLDVMDDKKTIIDFKSVDRKKPAGWEKTETQPSFYTLLVKNYYGIEPAFKYHIIKDIDDERDSTRTEEDCNKLLDYIKIFIASVNTGIFKPAEPGHWLCSEKWCGYWPLCRYAQK